MQLADHNKKLSYPILRLLLLLPVRLLNGQLRDLLHHLSLIHDSIFDLSLSARQLVIVGVVVDALEGAGAEEEDDGGQDDSQEEGALKSY